MKTIRRFIPNAIFMICAFFSYWLLRKTCLVPTLFANFDFSGYVSLFVITISPLIFVSEKYYNDCHNSPLPNACYVLVSLALAALIISSILALLPFVFRHVLSYPLLPSFMGTVTILSIELLLQSSFNPILKNFNN